MIGGDEHSRSHAPAKLGRYEVLLPLARGGMGAVYLARLPKLERHVAIKVMHVHLREDASFATELIEEAKLTGMIDHPNVVPVLDAGEGAEGVFLVMDYVEGDSLDGLHRMLGDEPMPERIGLRILVDALRGLHAAHELRSPAGAFLGLVHRDFTPQNILVGVDGVTRLTDFGVAKAATRNSHTATGLIKGKLHYMPPEQARSDPLDRRSDVWSAGVILWELLAHQRMYSELTDTAVLMTLITEEPPPLASARPAAPAAFDEICRWALTREADDRCPSAKALADAIEEAAQTLGGLADEAEVGRFVARLAGEVLAERRQQVEAIVGPATPDPRARPVQSGAAEAPSNAVAKSDHKVDEPTTFEPHNASRRPEKTSARSWLRSSVALLAGVLVVVGVMEARRGLRPDAPKTVAATPSNSEAPSARRVTLLSEVPIAAVVIGERRRSFSEPSTEVEVLLSAAEAGERRLEVVGRDGRRIRVDLTDEARIEVDFGAPDAPAPQ